MIPDAPLDGKLLSVKPEDRSGDFTFSRGSNLAATRVGADGLIEKGRENLLLQSNQFDTTWTKSTAITATSGQSGYDGSSDAWLLERSDGSARYIQQAISLSGINTISFYAKADNENWVFVGTSSANAQCYYNLSDGSIGTKGSLVVDANAEYIGSGWYRISMTINGAFTYIRIYPAVGNESVSGATDASLFIQDAQAEIGLAATDYIESGATTGKAGLLEDEPRFDYSSGATCPSLLLEPSRTNDYIQSEYLYNFEGNETFNAATSPEGVSNATKLTKTSASDQFLNILWTGATISPSTDYTISLFVKYSGDDVDVRYEQNSGVDWGAGWNALFQVRSSGVTKSTTSNCTSDVEDYGNGWYRILVFVTSLAGATPASPSNLLRLIGASGDEVLVYGAVQEVGSYPTSYIPTYGTSVTRNDDLCTATSVEDLIGQTEGNILHTYLRYECDSECRRYE